MGHAFCVRTSRVSREASVTDFAKVMMGLTSRLSDAQALSPRPHCGKRKSHQKLRRVLGNLADNRACRAGDRCVEYARAHLHASEIRPQLLTRMQHAYHFGPKAVGFTTVTLGCNTSYALVDELSVTGCPGLRILPCWVAGVSGGPIHGFCVGLDGNRHPSRLGGCGSRAIGVLKGRPPVAKRKCVSVCF